MGAYGKIVIAVVLAIVLLVAVRQGCTAWQISRAEASASAYQQALQSNDVIGALEAQLGQLSAGYKMLAQFQIAAEHAASGDFVAEARYLRLASDGSVDPLYQQAATLLSVMVAPRDVDVSSLRHVCLIWRLLLDHGRQWRWRLGLAWHCVMEIKIPPC